VGDPGDIIYLPPDWWHIGEDVGGLSMTVTLALFMEELHPRATGAGRDLSAGLVKALLEKLWSLRAIVVEM
jgi:hypothetical protein